MTKTFIGVRDVNEETFRKFKVISLVRKERLGEALNKAMNKFIEEEGKRTVKKFHLSVEPFDWGRGSEKTSKEVDKLLYS